jgi:SAM-dependent methyltransferase
MNYFGFCKGIKNLNLPNLNEVNFYDGYFADFYDHYVQHDMDISIYTDLIKKYGNNVLELACGSGRVLAPLLEYGANVDGVDISKDMLEKAEKKCVAHKHKLKLFCGDMVNFESDIKYDVIILAQLSLCLLKNQEERIELFRNVSRNLRSGGVFVYNYEDMPIEGVKESEKKPVYLFNPKRKSFIIINEKKITKNGICLINLYSEEIDECNNVKRYLSVLTKAILSKAILEDIISQTLFSKLDEHIFRTDNSLIRFEVLKKE